MPAADATARRLRSIAFYLPQFHPIPENDEWWGTGFTEWTNVAKAKPAFRGHYQPHLPGELGFYDLRLPEVRAQQAALAAAYGVSAFCYYHYWFNGQRLLERPFAEVLASGEPDLPFLLCWANEPWSRRWDGSEREVLMPQAYSEVDHRAHVRHLAEAWADPRYLRVDGKPLFLVYRAAHVPDARQLTDVFRDEASRLGIGELYLARVESFPDDRTDPRPLGFDAGVEFQPDVNVLSWRLVDALSAQLHLGPTGRRRLFQRSVVPDVFEPDGGPVPPAFLLRQVRDLIGRRYVPGHNKHFVFPQAWAVDEALRRPSPTYPRFPCVSPSWDNTARRKQGAIILDDARPETFQHWVTETVRRSEWRGAADLLFVNAWNEWAEGCHLEPDQRWGRAWLEALQAGVGAGVRATHA